MNNKQHIHLIAAYLDGNITAAQRAELNKLIEQGEIDILEVKEMESFYQQVGNLPEPAPSSNLRKQFYTMLEQEKDEPSLSFSHTLDSWSQKLNSYFTLPQLAYAAGIFIVGLMIGNLVTPFQNYRGELATLSTEVSQMREVMMMNLLDDNSATERLKAVNISTDISTVDKRITKALFNTLNNDSNVNVRLAAVEALVQHASAPSVRQGLVASIDKQDSPIIQSALADAMLILQEKSSVQKFRHLLDQNGLEPGVRDKLEHTIAVLS